MERDINLDYFVVTYKIKTIRGELLGEGNLLASIEKCKVFELEKAIACIEKDYPQEDKYTLITNVSKV